MTREDIHEMLDELEECCHSSELYHKAQERAEAIIAFKYGVATVADDQLLIEYEISNYILENMVTPDMTAEALKHVNTWWRKMRRSTND
jgi:predicted translin family RNA/ssDNA-binding protein